MQLPQRQLGNYLKLRRKNDRHQINTKPTIDKNSKAKSSVSPNPSPKIVEDNGLPIAVGQPLNPNPQLANPNPNPIPPSKEIIPTTVSSEAVPSVASSAAPPTASLETPAPTTFTDSDGTGTTLDNSNNNYTLEAEPYDLNNDAFLKAHGADSSDSGTNGVKAGEGEKENPGSADRVSANTEESPPVDDVRGSSSGLESLLDKYGTMNSNSTSSND
ncbi:UNVERIFIED_CONTAM: hypothetical protein HDU68_012257 [Siphonaria sp. JEL0065]|nr:hypothetical protein HDU68_012257 [Siphonaria sp. JEL0065]